MAKNHSNEHYIVAIDIGSSKIVVFFAEQRGERLEIFGQARGKSDGVVNGEVVDSSALSRAIKEVGDAACLSCNSNFDSVNVNISDANIKVFNLNPHTYLDSGKVRESDVKSIIKTAEAVKMEKTARHINSVAQRYILDKDPHTNQGVVVKQPIGESADTLEVNMHIVCVSEQQAKNIERSIAANGSKVLNFVPSSMAAGESYLTQEQKNSGICLVDIGSGTMDLSVFKNGSIFYSGVIQQGADLVSNAIADAFGASFAEAERLKLKRGQAQVKNIIEDELISFKKAQSSKDYYLSYQALIEVIEEAYEQLFTAIKANLKEQNLLRSLNSGFVLVGGGAKMQGLDDLALDCLKKRSKIGRISTNLIRIDTNSISTNEDLLAPEYASAIGLLLFKNDESGLKEQQSNNNEGILSKIREIKKSF
ncbi:MAG: cell division protein FtsA [Candidatus Thioglobus sp.]|nr:MAG: cell division protein FtsA [Candidatus Thioglobus sp.]